MKYCFKLEIHKLKCFASMVKKIRVAYYRWSFGPNFTWGSLQRDEGHRKEALHFNNTCMNGLIGTHLTYVKIELSAI